MSCSLSANAGNMIEALRMMFMDGMLAQLKANAAKQEESEDRGNNSKAE